MGLSFCVHVTLVEIRLLTIQHCDFPREVDYRGFEGNRSKTVNKTAIKFVTDIHLLLEMTFHEAPSSGQIPG